jgi:hypothetical protein
MKPKFGEFLVASPYTLPFWLLAVAYLYSLLSDHWEMADAKTQVSCVVMLAMWAAVTLRAIPKVWRYHYQQYKQARAGRTPEQIAEQRRRRKPLHLFLAFSGGIAGLWWLREHPFSDNEVNSYALLTCFLFAAIPVMFLAFKLVYRLPSMFRRIRSSVPKKPEKPFIVQWCQPVPKQAAGAAQIRGALPDYCKTLLSSAQPGEKKEAATQARNPLSAVADVAAIHS